VVFSDASGAEWCDKLVTIRTGPAPDRRPRNGRRGALSRTIGVNVNGNPLVGASVWVSTDAPGVNSRRGAADDDLWRHRDGATGRRRLLRLGAEGRLSRPIVGQPIRLHDVECRTSLTGMNSSIHQMRDSFRGSHHFAIAAKDLEHA
jgi:hypothetical protein